MADRSPYALSDSENERIFQRYILPVILPPSLGRADKPEAVILGGQPGSGKTALLTQATEELWSRGPTVVVVGDELRSFHPQYAQLQRLEPLKAADFTNEDSGRWVEKVIAASREKGVNLVIESTMRRPDVFEKTARDLREAGYRVEARALAVNERVSWQGVHARYEAMIAAGDAPRFTTRESHDAGARGVVETLSQIEARGLADRVAIAGRGGQVLYDNELIDGRWRDPPAAARALSAERDRPRTADELNRHDAGWQTILAQMAGRGAPVPEQQSVKQQAKIDREAFQGQARSRGEVEFLVPPRILPRPDFGGDRRKEDLHREAQARANHGIPVPSPALRSALESIELDNGRAVTQSNVYKEFTKLERALDARLSGSDRRAIREGRIPELAGSLGISQDVAPQVASLSAQTKIVRAILNEQVKSRMVPSLER